MKARMPPAAEALRAFAVLSHRCAVREGGCRQRGGTALARRPLAWARRGSQAMCGVSADSTMDHPHA